MEYTLKIEELIKRPVIRKDKFPDFLNKMTDEEILQFEKEIESNLLEDSLVKQFPDWQIEFIAKVIDRDILYNILLKS